MERPLSDGERDLLEEQRIDQMDAAYDELPRPLRARFWVWANGAHARITLFGRKPVRWDSGGPTEEGFSWTGHTFVIGTRKGRNVVLHEWYGEARDCDGSYSNEGSAFAFLDELQSVPCESEPGVLLPAWQTVYSEARDHAAEAAGY